MSLRTEGDVEDVGGEGMRLTVLRSGEYWDGVERLSGSWTDRRSHTWNTRGVDDIPRGGGKINIL